MLMYCKLSCGDAYFTQEESKNTYFNIKKQSAQLVVSNMGYYNKVTPDSVQVMMEVQVIRLFSPLSGENMGSGIYVDHAQVLAVHSVFLSCS